MMLQVTQYSHFFESAEDFFYSATFIFTKNTQYFSSYNNSHIYYRAPNNMSQLFACTSRQLVFIHCAHILQMIENLTYI